MCPEVLLFVFDTPYLPILNPLHPVSKVTVALRLVFRTGEELEICDVVAVVFVPLDDLWGDAFVLELLGSTELSAGEDMINFISSIPCPPVTSVEVCQ